MCIAALALAAVALPSFSMCAVVTAYCLRGTTATGTHTHPGSIAVDPAVIRLGSRIYVPGYGWGRAEDTGSAVRGAHIDVWMSSCSAAIRHGAPWLRITVR